MDDDVGTFVRTHDLDRYLASLFALEDKRPHLWSLYAFAAEIADIARKVSEPQLGEIRLQYWLDVLQVIYSGGAPENPLARGLAAAIAVGDLPRRTLEQLVNAHQFELYSDPMPSHGALETYLEDTEGALTKLAAMVLDRRAGQEDTSVAANRIGVAYGTMRLLNALPRRRSLRQNDFIPLELLEANTLTAATFAQPGHEAATAAVLANLRNRAAKRLEQARDAFDANEGTFVAYLHGALTQTYLRNADRQGTAVLTKGCDASQLRKQLVLWKAARQRQF